MRRVRLSSRGAIRHVNYGPGTAGTGLAPSPGRVVRIIPGIPANNRGVRRPSHPVNYLPFHPFRTHTPGYY